MAHKTLIGGAGYSVSGGRPLIGGAGYTIAKGRTLIGGAGYDLPFKMPTFDEIMADMEIISANGRNSNSTGTLYTAFSPTESGTVYALQFINGLIAITRADFEVVNPQTINVISADLLVAASQNRITFIEGYYAAGKINLAARASYDGTGSDLCYVNGGTIALVRFPSYVPSQVDAAIRSVTFTKLAGRDNSSTGTVGATYDPAGRWLTSFYYNAGTTYAKFAYSSPLGTVIFSNSEENPSLLTDSGTTRYLSFTPTSPTNLRSGAIVSVSG